MPGSAVARGKERGQNGGVAVLLAVAIVPLMLCFAVAFDGFLVMASDLQQDNNAEYAALAALEHFQALEGQEITYRKSAATAQAEQVAGMNFYLGAPGEKQVAVNDLADGTAGLLTFGTYAPADGTFLAGPNSSNNYNAVMLQLVARHDRSVKVYFAGSMGVKQVELQSTVIAHYDDRLAASGRYPFILSHIQ